MIYINLDLYGIIVISIDVELYLFFKDHRGLYAAGQAPRGTLQAFFLCNLHIPWKSKAYTPDFKGFLGILEIFRDFAGLFPLEHKLSRNQKFTKIIKHIIKIPKICRIPRNI